MGILIEALKIKGEIENVPKIDDTNIIECLEEAEKSQVLQDYFLTIPDDKRRNTAKLIHEGKTNEEIVEAELVGMGEMSQETAERKKKLYLEMAVNLRRFLLKRTFWTIDTTLFWYCVKQGKVLTGIKGIYKPSLSEDIKNAISDKKSIPLYYLRFYSDYKKSGFEEIGDMSIEKYFDTTYEELCKYEGVGERFISSVDAAVEKCGLFEEGVFQKHQLRGGQKGA